MRPGPKTRKKPGKRAGFFLCKLHFSICPSALRSVTHLKVTILGVATLPPASAESPAGGVNTCWPRRPLRTCAPQGPLYRADRPFCSS
jgi:hypothetical protein